MKYKRKKTGELELFLELWDERPHVCQVSGDYLPEFSVGCMAHCLTKGAYGSMRLNKKNIIFMRYDLHHMYDHQTDKAKKDPRFKWVFELAEELRSESNSNKGYNVF